MIAHQSIAPVEDSPETVEVSVEMPADMIAALRVAGFQRQSLGYSEAALCNLVCEAVSEWLEREIEGTATISVRL